MFKNKIINTTEENIVIEKNNLGQQKDKVENIKKDEVYNDIELSNELSNDIELSNELSNDIELYKNLSQDIKNFDVQDEYKNLNNIQNIIDNLQIQLESLKKESEENDTDIIKTILTEIGESGSREKFLKINNFKQIIEKFSTMSTLLKQISENNNNRELKYHNLIKVISFKIENFQEEKDFINQNIEKIKKLEQNYKELYFNNEKIKNEIKIFENNIEDLKIENNNLIDNNKKFNIENEKLKQDLQEKNNEIFKNDIFLKLKENEINEKEYKNNLLNKEIELFKQEKEIIKNKNSNILHIFNFEDNNLMDIIVKPFKILKLILTSILKIIFFSVGITAIIIFTRALIFIIFKIFSPLFYEINYSVYSIKNK